MIERPLISRFLPRSLQPPTVAMERFRSSNKVSNEGLRPLCVVEAMTAG